MPPAIIVIMGVSGCGKSTVGKNLANALHVPFIDADDLHPKANVDKMASGEPLNDEDRFPWLNIVRNAAVKTCSVEDAASHETGVVIACSALKRSYRGLLRGITGDEVHVNSHSKLPTYFGFIQGPKEVLFERMSARKNHFMKAKMLDSQIATLEDPSGEDGVFIINLVDNPEQQTQRALETLAKWGVQPARASHPERDQVGHGVPVDIDTEKSRFYAPFGSFLDEY